MAKSKKQMKEETTAAEIAQVAAPALTPVEAVFISRVFAEKRVKEAIEGLVPNGTEANVDVTVHFSGHFSRGEGTTRAATSRALRKGTLALLVRRMGLQRDAALALLADVLIESQKLGEDAEEKLLAEHPEVEEAFTKVDELVALLPRISAAGATKLIGVKVERVK